MIAAVRVEDPGKLSDAIAANLQIPVEEKQELLEIFEPVERLNRIADILEVEIEKLNVDRSINTRVKRQMERAQKEYYLNEKLKAIQKELGRGEANEIEQLKKKIETSGMPEGPMEKAMQELKRLEMMPPMSAESTVSRNYLDWLLAVPWKKRSKEIRDIKRAEKILSEDHYGLEKIKERILEYLAVRQLVKNPKGSILCFLGPPGVGKTSLAMSIGRATGRKFVRVSLGGVRDEAEIRGHRRTYIGALPGQIIQMMRKAGTTNPVFVLDEVDKMSMDFRGDPSAALMEVLDPELNHSFTDHYLDVEYDLSKVMFICTANVLHTNGQRGVACNAEFLLLFHGRLHWERRRRPSANRVLDSPGRTNRTAPLRRACFRVLECRTRTTSASFHDRAGFLHHGAPLLVLALDERAELLGRAADGVRAFFDKARLDWFLRDDLVGGLVEDRDRLLRRALRSEHREPRARLEAGIARLLHGRNIRHRARAVPAAHRDRRERAGLDLSDD